MRVLVCSLLLSIGLFAQKREASRLFPIPKGLDKSWPNAVLSDNEKKLLKEAVEPDLRDLDCAEKPTFDSLEKTSIALGRLGKGVMVATNSQCTCGGTGTVRRTCTFARRIGIERFCVMESGSPIAGLSTWSIPKPVFPILS